MKFQSDEKYCFLSSLLRNLYCNQTFTTALSCLQIDVRVNRKYKNKIQHTKDAFLIADSVEYLKARM